MAVTGIHGGSSIEYPTGGTRQELEARLSQLTRQRSECSKQGEDPALKERISNLEKRISNLESRIKKLKAEENDGKCETCENRKYQDGSDDPGVSFKTAAKVGPQGAESAVRGHEAEHVSRDRAEAQRNDREVVYQSVIIKRAICPECGRSYVSGGQTTTVTRKAPEKRFSVGMNDNAVGRKMNVVA
ncbi:MAG: hypothetical protein ACI4KM_09945 [Oscillospiraceae bacterium]